MTSTQELESLRHDLMQERLSLRNELSRMETEVEEAGERQVQAETKTLIEDAEGALKRVGVKEEIHAVVDAVSWEVTYHFAFENRGYAERLKMTANDEVAALLKQQEVKTKEKYDVDDKLIEVQRELQQRARAEKSNAVR